MAGLPTDGEALTKELKMAAKVGRNFVFSAAAKAGDSFLVFSKKKIPASETKTAKAKTKKKVFKGVCFKEGAVLVFETPLPVTPALTIKLKKLIKEQTSYKVGKLEVRQNPDCEEGEFGAEPPVMASSSGPSSASAATAAVDADADADVDGASATAEFDELKQQIGKLAAAGFDGAAALLTKVAEIEKLIAGGVSAAVIAAIKALGLLVRAALATQETATEAAQKLLEAIQEKIERLVEAGWDGADALAEQLEGVREMLADGLVAVATPALEALDQAVDAALDALKDGADEGADQLLALKKKIQTLVDAGWSGAEALMQKLEDIEKMLSGALARLAAPAIAALEALVDKAIDAYKRGTGVVVDEAEQEVEAALAELQAEVDKLEKASSPEASRFKSEHGRHTKTLAKILKSSDPQEEKLNALTELVAAVKTSTGDAQVAGMDLTDPDAGPALVKEIEDRFDVTLELTGGDPEDEAATLHALYLTLSKAPLWPADELEVIKVDLQAPDSETEGGLYDPDTNTVEINCRRPDDSLNYGDELGSVDQFPEPPGVDEDCQPANDDPVKYFNWATLHEVGHALDEQKGFMDSNLTNPKYGGWTELTTKVGPIATALIDELAGSLGEDEKKELRTYARKLMKNAEPPELSDEAQAAQAAIDEWIAAVREDEGLWWNGSGSTQRAIGGRVYHEAYEGWWTSYDLAARTKGIHGYQFRAPAEWFAELYAAYYSQKLKDSHPFVPELKKLEA